MRGRSPETTSQVPQIVTRCRQNQQIHRFAQSGTRNSKWVTFEKSQVLPTRVPALLRDCTDPDPTLLDELLASGLHNPTSFCVALGSAGWDCALNQVIFHGFFDRLIKLLIAGANPNGYPTWCFDSVRARYLRGRPAAWTREPACFLQDWKALAPTRVDSLLFHAPLWQPITPKEIHRRKVTRGRFWADHDFPLLNLPEKGPIHSLTACAMTGNISAYECLVGHGADEKCWTGQQLVGVRSGSPPSALAAESPLNAAVFGEDETMLRFLLGRGHKPDHFTAVMPTRPVSPVMQAIAKYGGPWLVGFDIMADHADLSITTPMFGCHVLHFATATLDLDIIWHVADILGSPRLVNSAPLTALGHSLLHVACLPHDDSFVNLHSLPIYESIHEFRALDTNWIPQVLARDMKYPDEARLKALSAFPGPTRSSAMWTDRQRRASRFRRAAHSVATRPPFFIDDAPVEEQSAQRRVVRFLLSSSWNKRAEIARQDVHGNTILHYLASYRYPDLELIDWIRGVWDACDEVESRTLTSGERGGSQLQNGEGQEDEGTYNWISDPFTHIWNRWGFSASDLFLNGEKAKASWGMSFMPFWRDLEI